VAKSEGRVPRVPDIVFDWGLAELVPPKQNVPSTLLDTRVVYCGDNLEQLAKAKPLWRAGRGFVIRS